MSTAGIVATCHRKSGTSWGQRHYQLTTGDLCDQVPSKHVSTTLDEKQEDQYHRPHCTRAETLTGQIVHFAPQAYAVEAVQHWGLYVFLFVRGTLQAEIPLNHGAQCRWALSGC